ncbi:MAG TPA: carbohydrate ABC transporter permease [Deinococcales bacterium]|nr:carbohydrate ABC transporter permease [Deinococcales bacterium]
MQATVPAATAPAKKRAKVGPGLFLGYVLLVLGAIGTIAPFYFMFVFATHTRTTIFNLPPPVWFGQHFLDNYAILIGRIPFWRQLWNSFYLASVATVTAMFFCALGGYGFAMYNFKGRNVLFTLLMATMLIPGLLNLVPFYLVMQALGWINQPRALWVPGMAGAMGIFLMRQYIGSAIPRELVEAARIDGASEFGIFLRIILPLSGPAMSTLGLITFIGSWNNFTGPLIIFRSAETYTVQLGLRSMQGMGNTEWGALMAGTALAVIPLLLIFTAASRQLIEGLTAGSMKG